MELIALPKRGRAWMDGMVVVAVDDMEGGGGGSILC